MTARLKHTDDGRDAAGRTLVDLKVVFEKGLDFEALANLAAQDVISMIRQHVGNIIVKNNINEANN